MSFTIISGVLKTNLKDKQKTRNYHRIYFLIINDIEKNMRCSKHIMFEYKIDICLYLLLFKSKLIHIIHSILF